MRTKPLLLTASALLLLAISGCTAWRVAESVELVRQSEPLQVRPPAPAMRLLVVGDSTAVGTGASAPQASLVGLLAARFPSLLIQNRTRDGATFADVAAQLAGADLGRFDMVLVNAGGNDVIRLRNIVGFGV